MTTANDPAMPVQIDNDVDVHNYGLTKREYFANSAPAEIPEWYRHIPPANDTPQPPSWHDIKDEKDARWCRDWLNDGNFDLPENLQWFQTAHEAYSFATSIWEQENKIARYFQWRTFYADSLIAALNK